MRPLYLKWNEPHLSPASQFGGTLSFCENPQKPLDRCAYVYAKDDAEKEEITQWFEAANQLLSNVHL